MSICMHRASVPVFTQILGGLRQVLVKTATHAAERGYDPAVLLQARLFPDMFELNRQVHIACEFARSVCARLAGLEPPTVASSEGKLPALLELIDASTAFINGIAPEALEHSAERRITLRPGTPKERHLDGASYLLNYGLPQFFFHVTTSYALLRHNGVEIGKKDYMGAY